MNEHLRNTRCEIDLDKLERNTKKLFAHIGSDVTPMAVIKADAYGHGAVMMMQYMKELGVRYFAVATLNEAMELRRHHKDTEILILGLTPDTVLHHAAENNIMLTIESLRQAKILSALGIPARVQIKMDSGMHRLGYTLSQEHIDEVAAISKLPNIRIDGIFSHLALKDREGDLWQWTQFTDFIRGCEAQGVTFPLKSICDGIGTLRYPEMRLNMVRPGAFFYGFSPEDSTLEPIMELKSEIVHLTKIPKGEGLGYDLDDIADHDRLVASLPFGYIDGCPRAMSHYQGWVSIRGKRAPFIGLLCMDQSMVDVTDIEGVSLGDEVVIFSNFHDAMDYPTGAKISNFNRNGLESAAARRVPRVYLRDGKEVGYRDYLEY